MRIQQTDQILKESRHARHNTALHESKRNWLARLWSSITSLFH
jgi:hypothetical protein